MSTIVYRISVLLSAIVADVPVGTNLGLFWLLWALISGRFLLSRGAVFPALADGGDCRQRPCAALARRWRMDAGPSRPSSRRGTRWSSRKAAGTRIGRQGSARWPVTWSASSALGSAAVSARTTTLGLTKRCRPSSSRSLRRSVRLAKDGSPWCVCAYGPNRATAVTRRCNAGPSRRREPPDHLTKSSSSTPGSAWPPCSPGVCHALWRGWRAT